ncbi:hypothetical protein QZH56_03545 [Streptomyces olivoreticuli]|uniref:hypothetical protein n=1 Tax=Streptomyces olivoreticuli TaxID=68246 RepID=UPI00265B560C|nr:hypothetical protein [Streptomyces olivoreticuli]WKK24721.1 hypothetical protein QZH56_03545 [Streptomyces olivoreticuli]
MPDRIKMRPARLATAVSTVALLLGTVAACGTSSTSRTDARPTSASSTTSPATATAEAIAEEETAITERTDEAQTEHRPSGAESTDSPGRHDGSNYDNLSPEGKEAHDTENCAKIPGKRKGSCNEPHRKCKESGATAVSSGGAELTCRIWAKDGRLHWLAEGE